MIFATTPYLIPRLKLSFFYSCALVLILTAVSFPQAFAQTQPEAAPAEKTVLQSPPTQTAAELASAPVAQHYTSKNLKSAFDFIDANKDGQISREEAAGFRGVAKYFDRADINHDGVLSREEFENALEVANRR